MLKPVIMCGTALLLAAACAAPASADIRINVSRYQNGKLDIEGQTRPNSAVTLDGRYKTTSNAGGYFVFKEPHYKPDTCMSNISSGADVYSAVIAGCFGELTIEQNIREPAAKAPTDVTPASVAAH